jgi:DNA topoisomerase-1
MSQDPKVLCRREGLTYVESSGLALRRRRCGKGFSYCDAAGRTVRDKGVRARIKALAIPPAWSDVRIAEDAKAHLQATGRDADGRLQYRYHPNWERIRATAKEQRLLRFGAALPRLRRAVKYAFADPGLTRTKVIAAIVRLIDLAVLRAGHEQYARAEGGRGATTLLKDDVVVEGDKVVLEFAGKGGKRIRQEVKDPPLAGMVRRLRSLRGRRLFKAPDEKGDERPITAREVNAFIAKATGLKISAKDFRTFRASAAALALLGKRNGEASEKARNKAVIEAADAASVLLANTRTVARSSYIHPSIIDAYEQGKLKRSLFGGRIRRGLNKMESALVRFLEGPTA